jgi:DNA polymerase III delta subunit
MAVRRTSFARCLREVAKAPRTHVWAFVGAEKALADMAMSRISQELGLPTRRISKGFTPLNVLHTMGELDFMADKWVVVLDGVKKIDRLDQFKKDIPAALGENYLFIVGEDLAEDVQEWVAELGKVVNCEKIENRKDLMDVMDRIFSDEQIRLTSSAVNAIIGLTGYSVGALKNAAGLLRVYYKPEGGPLDLDYNEIIHVVPSLSYEDVFSVVSEVLYRNMHMSLDYYQKLKQRQDVQMLFLSLLLSVFRDLWVYARLGELSQEQQQELGVDQRTYAKIKSVVTPSEQDLSRIYCLVLDVYRHSKSAANEDFVVEALLVHIIRILQGEEVGQFPITRRHAKIAPPCPTKT